MNIVSALEYFHQWRAQQEKRTRIQARGGRKANYWATDGGGCARKIAYQRLGVPPTNQPGPRNLRIFENGEYVEERYVNTFKAMGILEGTQVPWRIEREVVMNGQKVAVVVSGKIDIVVNWGLMPKDFPNRAKLLELAQVDPNDPSTWRAVVEMKSKNSYSFKKEVKAGEFDEGYILQCQFYLEAWGAVQNPPVTKAILLQESKDDQDLYGHVVRPDPVLLNEALLKFASIENSVMEIEDRLSGDPAIIDNGFTVDVADLLPMRCSPTADAFPCSWGKGERTGYCDFYAKCWGPESNLVAAYDEREFVASTEIVKSPEPATVAPNIPKPPDAPPEPEHSRAVVAALQKLRNRQTGTPAPAPSPAAPPTAPVPVGSRRPVPPNRGR